MQTDGSANAVSKAGNEPGHSHDSLEIDRQKLLVTQEGAAERGTEE